LSTRPQGRTFASGAIRGSSREGPQPFRGHGTAPKPSTESEAAIAGERRGLGGREATTGPPASALVAPSMPSETRPGERLAPGLAANGRRAGRSGDRHSYDPEKRTAFEAWGRRLEQIVSRVRQSGEVVRLSRRTAAR
jgi:hypothetical protein